MSALYTYDSFTPGSVLGEWEEPLDARLLALWERLFGQHAQDAPARQAGLALGMLLLVVAPVQELVGKLLHALEAQVGSTDQHQRRHRRDGVAAAASALRPRAAALWRTRTFHGALPGQGNSGRTSLSTT